MRHGKGTDLPGMTDPEGAQIGVVYVAPEDDRKTIGTAILAEERLNREQIVLILPSQNKAFQSPNDFDYLKELRRKINAELIIVTPAGTDPAEFARQRRFPVFSTEESFVRSFTTGSPNPPTWATSPPASNRPARRGLFGLGGAKNVAPLAAGGAGFVAGEAAGNAANGPARQGLTPASAVPDLPTQPVSQRPSRSLRPVPPPQTPNPQMEDEEEVDTADQPDNNGRGGRGELRNAGLAGAAGLGAGFVAADLAQRRVAPTGRATQGVGPTIDSDDEWDALPPAPAQPGPANLPNTPTTEAGIAGARATSAVGSSSRVPATVGEPNPIELPTSRGVPRATKKLPPAPVAAMATQAVPPPTTTTTTTTAPPRRNTGKVAAAGAAGAVVGAVAVGALAGNATNSGNAPAGATRVAGGSRPPMRNLSSIGPGGPGAGGPLPPRRTPPPGRNRWRIALVALILLLLLFLLGAWALSTHPGMLASVGITGNANPPTTITITPASKTVQDTYVMQGVTTGPADPALRQVTVRSLTSTKTTTKPANVTGHTQTQAVAATGTLTFFNGSASQVTIAPTIISVNGIQVIANQNATIPGLNLSTHVAGSATVNAHAVSPGVSGNVAGGMINGTCCLQDGSISVTNGTFSGGQNAQDYKFLQVSDVNTVVNANQDGLRTEAQNDIKGQMKTGEQLLGDITCNDPKTTEDVLPGARGVNVNAANVTVSVTCNAQVFDAGSAQTIAQQALQQKASKDPGPGYVLAGTITTQAQKPQIQPDSTSTTFPVMAQGVWYYSWTKAMQQSLFNKIKGKSAKEAQTILNSYPGVGSAKVSIGNGGTTLPTDINQITFDIQKVNGFSGGSQQPGSGNTGTGGNSTVPSSSTITPVAGNSRIPVQTVGPAKG